MTTYLYNKILVNICMNRDWCLPRSRNVLHNFNHMFQYISISFRLGYSRFWLIHCKEFFHCLIFKTKKKFVTYSVSGRESKSIPSKKCLLVEFSYAVASYFLLLSVTIGLRSLALIDDLQIFFKLFNQIPVHNSFPSHTCYTPRPSSPSGFNHANIWQNEQIMKILQ